MNRAIVPRSVRTRLALLLTAALLLAPALSAAATEQLPDLVSLPPENLYLETNAEGRRLLRFTQGIANIGKGPLRVRGVKQSAELADGIQEILDENGAVVRTAPASSVIFHPHHNHWHADDVAAYELRQGAPWGPITVSNGKVSYCFVDDKPLPGWTGKKYPSTYLNCKTYTMGLNPGWVDIYKASLPDQWVDITDVPDGFYYLVIRTDPFQMYEESNKENNTAWLRLELTDKGGKFRLVPADEILVRVEGERQRFDVYPRITNGRTLAHVRLAERLGATVDWDGTHVTVAKGSKRIEITPGERTALVGGVPVDMGTAALKENGRVLVPIGFLCAQLDVTVAYDWLAAAIDITLEPPAAQPVE